MNSAHSITFIDRIRHMFNPLHVYCRLTCFGISSKCALNICKVYEESIYKPTLGRQ